MFSPLNKEFLIVTNNSSNSSLLKFIFLFLEILEASFFGAPLTLFALKTHYFL